MMDNRPRRTRAYGSEKSMMRQFAEILVILVAVAALFSFFNIQKDASSSVFSFQADFFCFSPSDEITCTVEYSEILTLSLVDTPETFGTCKSGGTENGLVYGCWLDSGEERLVSVLTALPKTILLETAEDTLIFNFTDEKNTEALYVSLQEAWQETSADQS